MKLGHDTAERYPVTRHQSLVEQMRELRELRNLVRRAETKRSNGRKPRFTGRKLFKLH